jgi:hypothetical protein
MSHSSSILPLHFLMLVNTDNYRTDNRLCINLFILAKIRTTSHNSHRHRHQQINLLWPATNDKHPAGMFHTKLLFKAIMLTRLHRHSKVIISVKHRVEMAHITHPIRKGHTRIHHRRTNRATILVTNR